jgi:hypothetical protein
VPTDIAEQKRLVSRFLRQSNLYADERLVQYSATMRAAAPIEAREAQAKIEQWQTYKAFNEHALAELATDRLDDWFNDDPETGA